jgi:lipoate-protein ligase A
LLQQIMPAASGEDPCQRFQAIGWLNRFASQPLGIDEVEDALIAGFTASLGLRFEQSVPTTQERRMAERLCAEWYGNPEWTQAGPGYRGMRTDAVDG